MRKGLILTLLLLVLSAGTLVIAHGRVDRGKDAVALDETVLYGDKAVAAGLELDCRTQCNGHLFWDTYYTVGENPSIHTVFNFSQAEKRVEYERQPTGVVFSDQLSGFGSSTTSDGGLGLEDESAPMRDVAGRTAPGEEHTEKVWVKDYYDDYPVEVGFDLPGYGSPEKPYARAIFADYFKIPVWPEHQIEITVRKNADGNVYSLGASAVPEHNVYIESFSVLTDTGCFFTLAYRTASGELLDMSRIPGGYGIYYFPWRINNDQTIIDANGLETVYAVDPGRAEIVMLQASADKSELLLVTKEDGTYLLTVLDTKTAKPLSKLALFPVPENGSFQTIYVNDDFIVPISGDGTFAVISETADGHYERRITADMKKTEAFKFDLRSPIVMDFDGSRLAVAGFQNSYGGFGGACGFYLSVFDETGLVYLGKYDSSLDKSPLYDYSLRCSPVETDPLTVKWS